MYVRMSSVSISYLHVDIDLSIYHGRYEGGRENDPFDYTRVVGHADLSCIGINAPSHYLDCIPSDHKLVTGGIAWTKSGGRQRFPTSLALVTIDNEDFYVYRLHFAYNSDVMNDDYGKYTCRLLATGEALSINVTGGIIIEDTSTLSLQLQSCLPFPLFSSSPLLFHLPPICLSSFH